MHFAQIDGGICAMTELIRFADLSSTSCGLIDRDIKAEIRFQRMLQSPNKGQKLRNFLFFFVFCRRHCFEIRRILPKLRHKSET